MIDLSILGQDIQNNPRRYKKFSRTFIHVCAYHFLQIGRREIKETLKTNKNNFQIHYVQRILGRFIYYIDLAKARRFVKDIYIVLTTKRSSGLVAYRVQANEGKINKFDYAEADLIALSADKEEHILYNIKLVVNKDEIKKISSANLQLFASGNATGISAFMIIKNVYPSPLKENHQIFPILTTCQIVFS